MKSKPISHFVAGAVLAGAAILLFLTYYYMGLSFVSNFLTYIPPLVTISLMVFFVIQYANALDNDVTFGTLFGYAFKTTTIFALIMVAFLFAVNSLLPAYREAFMENMSRQMVSDDKLTDEQRELAINTTRKFFTIGMIGGGLVMNIIIGCIGGLIGATLATKNPRTPFENQT